MEEPRDDFEDVLEKVGFFGNFQKIYVVIFIFWRAFCLAAVDMNLILVLDVPDHWCHVPGRENFNFTLTEWKSLTTPNDIDNRGQSTHSSCQMFDINFNNNSINEMIEQSRKDRQLNFSHFRATECQHGYEYDHTWYESTIVTKENWVCEKDLYITNTFVVARIAEMAGTFVFGQMGDKSGRRFVFIISFFLHVIGRVAIIYTTHNYLIFLIFVAVASCAFNSFENSPLIILMEMSKNEHRAYISVASHLGWSLGAFSAPLLYWWLRSYTVLMWITTLPIFVIPFFYRLMIESPRWLLSQRRYEDALKQLKIIASVNKNGDLNMTENDLRKMRTNIEMEKTYGMLSLFSGFRMAKNTIIMAFVKCVFSVAGFTLILFSLQMGGNPFINFFLQLVTDVPSYFAGKYLADKIGRKWTSSGSFWLAFLICIPLLLIAADLKYSTLVLVLATAAKLILGISAFAVSLQTIELYPTSLRQSGMALGSLLGSIVGIAAPYFVYLGRTYDIRYPYYIITVLFFLGAFSSMFLPETLHRDLPDSLDEARDFGADQKFLGLPKANQRKRAKEQEISLNLSS